MAARYNSTLKEKRIGNNAKQMREFYTVSSTILIPFRRQFPFFPWAVGSRVTLLDLLIR